MRKLTTNAGFFIVSDYETKKQKVEERPDMEYSCSIHVEFKPKEEFAKKYKRICLIQAVKDDIKIYKLSSFASPTTILDIENHDLLNKTAGFGERKTEDGWAIDQQIYKKGSTTVCNLDPRYTECRYSATTGYRDHSPFEKYEKVNLGYVQNYVSSDKKLDSAILSDQPNAIYFWASKKAPNGCLEFEIVAMGEREDGEKEYLASLSWGWEIQGITSKNKKCIQKNDVVDCRMNPQAKDEYNPILTTKELHIHNKPSEAFIEAAKKWNYMIKQKLTQGDELSLKVFSLPES